MKTLRFLMMTVIALSCAQLATANDKISSTRAKGDLYVAPPGMNLRKGAGIHAPIIRHAEGHEVVMIDNTEEVDGFVQVRLKDGKPAWAAVKYLKKITDH